MSANALIVSAHPEPKSFTAALRAASEAVLRDAGCTVAVSDLYAMGFGPVVSRADFLSCHDPERLNVSLEQRHAHAQGALAPEIAGELARLQAADLLVFHFPLWWFGLPAILKGWIDRVFVSGATYGRSAMFESGRFRGKRAMVCVTTGGPRQAFGPGSLNGDMLELLAPLHCGVLAFTGMTVLPPFVAYHVPYAGDEERAGMLRDWGQHLAQRDTLQPLPMPRLDQHPDVYPRARRPEAR